MHKIDAADEAQLFATIDRWIEREVAPRVKEFDHADKWPAEIVEQMKELGLFGATVSPEYGGLGLPASTYAEIVIRISSVWMAIICERRGWLSPLGSTAELWPPRSWIGSSVVLRMRTIRRFS